MEIRRAIVEDAVDACSVLRRSILELCLPDHRLNPIILERWLSNKTPENVVSWITNTCSSVLVAAENKLITAVGAATDTGKITLNYVSPDARFRGVSKALLHQLEIIALHHGNIECMLESTVTAHRFYSSAGYVDTGPPVVMFGTTSYPMAKRLVK